MPVPAPRPFPIGLRGAVLAAIGLCGVWAFVALGLSSEDILPGADDWRVIGGFFAHALLPAMTYASPPGDPEAPAFLVLVGESLWLTIAFAATAVSLAVVLGVVLGFLGSQAWWIGDPAGAASPWVAILRRTVAPALYGSTRVVIALMRSVHELIWAVVLLAALGLSDLSAVIAIAIPFGGTLAKIFSEMIDEAPRDASRALREAGASGAQVFVFGLLPRALPDMGAYALYRFECALRSAAVLGFFGWRTIGYHVRQSWGELHFGEVWTYLYALMALVLLVEWWSGALRRRFVA
ncbi:MAG: ABC transporter permease subunit [Deltaproteobacteria bacterium]|jgi:phosphonate transport system permease protein|nr:ABC transporter permease subunit [Deltaproteobacteria bacterium]MBW2496770.1 ABC transporter permease subunit [Deltaproteobacteria bacterium]